MALIKTFIHKPETPARFRSEVECGWVVGSHAGIRILHLETYGSGDRAIPGKVSQAIELDRAAAMELRRIIDDAFPPSG